MSNNNELNQNNEIFTNNNSDSSACCNEQAPQQACAAVASTPQSMCEQLSVTPTVIGAGPVFVKIPVVLAETNITIPTEATITLDQRAMEIKRIKKNVFLNQCRLIPFSQDNRPGTGILFVAGFVRKNIEYATQTCPSGTAVNVCGDIRHCTIEVPFNCTVRVTFLRRPIFAENTTSSELEFFTDNLRSCDVCADPVVGRNPCDQNFSFTEFFNEKPFCELVRADITEIDIHRNPTATCQTPTEQMFTQITEKMVVNLTLKVLQNQQVRITSLGRATDC